MTYPTVELQLFDLRAANGVTAIQNVRRVTGDQIDVDVVVIDQHHHRFSASECVRREVDFYGSRGKVVGVDVGVDDRHLRPQIEQAICDSDRWGLASIGSVGLVRHPNEHHMGAIECFAFGETRLETTDDVVACVD